MNKLLSIEIRNGKGFSTRLTKVLPKEQALKLPVEVNEWDIVCEDCQRWGVAYTEHSAATGDPIQVKIMVRDPNIVDCPRCGGEGGWGDYDEGETCSLCDGNGCIDLSLTEPNEMEANELLAVAKDLHRTRDLYGPATRTPTGMVYELAEGIPKQRREEVLQCAWEHAVRGKIQEAIDLLDMGYFADSYKEELLLTASAWEEDE